MFPTLHTFHIPVMGTCYTADTPARVAPFGISSVVSLVDDILLERFRKIYAKKFDLNYEPIPQREPDGRAKRITAYLNTLADVVQIKFEQIKKQPFFQKNDKAKYFEMLPTAHPLRLLYLKLMGLKDENCSEKNEIETKLNQSMLQGSIDVNIMVKLDRLPPNPNGKESLPDEMSDAKTALKGYALSKLRNSAIVFSAGINQSLYNYMAQFKEFYRSTTGEIGKRIIVKASDLRSALIQGKFLARKGLEVSEYRIESGLNCGGHAFPSQGQLLPAILNEIRAQRGLLHQLHETVVKFYENKGWNADAVKEAPPARVTVQGGIGNYAESLRMQEYYGIDGVGWGSPFLLCPEVSPVDKDTRDLLAKAGEDDLYMSNSSPLNVYFNNLRGSGSERWHKKQIELGKPGSPCTKNFLQNNTEFSEFPVCTASRFYQERKLKQIDESSASAEEKAAARERVYEKQCICDHLGNSGLIFLGEYSTEQAADLKAPQSICPGPNIAWFNREYTMQEMVDHIYGRIPDLTPPERPHMFAKEAQMYGDWFALQVNDWNSDKDYAAWLRVAANNFNKSLDYCLEVANESTPFPGENLESIAPRVEIERNRLEKNLEILEWKVSRSGT
ncbi:hypothetical protein AGMMS49938_16660 [Fibrobacterales bacterium]|nr:hypothetical protein AGMMS49938_16660 [Fibrobacterales bacterium]